MPRIFFADPALKDIRGHHFMLTLNMSEHFLSFEYDVVWLANRQFEHPPELPARIEIKRTFSEDTYDVFRRRSLVPGAASSGLARQDKASQIEGFQKRLRQRVTGLRFWTARKLPFLTGVFGRKSKRGTTSSNAAVRRVAAQEYHQSTKSNQSPRSDRELLAALQESSFSPDDVVFFHTSDAHTYRDILRIFSAPDCIGKWNDLPTFHLSTPYDESVMPHNRENPSFDTSIRWMTHLGLIGRKVILHAENEILACHLSELTGTDISPLQIPPPDLTVSPRDHSTWTLSYFGAARTEKGFANVADAVLSVLDGESWPDIKFVIQANPQILGYTADIKAAVDKLRSISDDRLVLIQQPQPRSAYNHLLSTTDVAFLCYQRDRYSKRSSGIAVECVVTGTSMIATRDTFPAFLSAEPSLTVLDSDATDIEHAIHYSYEHRTELRRSAEDRKQEYLAAHTSEAFVGQLHNKGVRLDEIENRQLPRYQDPTNWRPLIAGPDNQSHNLRDAH